MVVKIGRTIAGSGCGCNMQNYDCLSEMNRGIWNVFLEEMDAIAPDADTAVKRRVADISTFLLAARKPVQAGEAVEEWLRLYIKAPLQLHRILKTLGVKPDENESLIVRISERASDWVIGKLSDHPIQDMPRC